MHNKKPAIDSSGNNTAQIYWFLWAKLFPFCPWVPYPKTNNCLKSRCSDIGGIEAKAFESGAFLSQHEKD